MFCSFLITLWINKQRSFGAQKIDTHFYMIQCGVVVSSKEVTKYKTLCCVVLSVWCAAVILNTYQVSGTISYFIFFQRIILTSLLFLALVFARTTSMASGMLVNLFLSGGWRYFFSLMISEARLFFSASKEPRGLHPMPLSHSRSDLYRFCEKPKQASKSHPPLSPWLKWVYAFTSRSVLDI